MREGYPYDPEDGREDLSTVGSRALRGGSWRGGRRLARVSLRGNTGPDYLFDGYIGFRVCVAAQQE